MLDMPPAEMEMHCPFANLMQESEKLVDRLTDALGDEDLPDEIGYRLRNLLLKLVWYGAIISNPNEIEKIREEIYEMIAEDEEEGCPIEEDWSYLLYPKFSIIDLGRATSEALELLQILDEKVQESYRL